MIIDNLFQLILFFGLASLGAANGPTCETTSGSPWLNDCITAIQNIDPNKGDHCIVPNEYKSKCLTAKKHGSCKVDLCFTGGTGAGAVQKNRIVDFANKLAKESSCARWAKDDNGNQGLKIGGYYTIDNPENEFDGDSWCHAPKQSMKIQFSKS